MKLWVLTKKNFKVLTRQNWLFLCCLLSPVFLFATMYLLQYMAAQWVKRNIEQNPVVENVNGIIGINEVKFGFTHGTAEWADFVVDDIKNKFPEVQVLTYPDMNQTGFTEKAAEGSGNKVAILFCTQEIIIGNNTVACIVPESDSISYIYTILYNFTYPNEILPQDLLQNEVISMKSVVDNSISAYVAQLSNQEVPQMELEIQSYPALDRYIGNYNVIATSGSVYLIFTSFLLSALIVQEVTKEKSEFLKIYLGLHEVSQLDYWLSWLLIAFALSFLCAAQIPIFGCLFGFEEFYNVSLTLQLTIFFIINASGVLTGALAAVMINDIKLGNTVSLSFIILGACIQFIACNQGIVKFLNYTENPAWISLIKIVLLAYPPFNFATIYFKVFNLAGVHFDYTHRMWLDGKSVGWEDIFEEESGTIWNEYEYYIPPVFYNMVYILLYIVVVPAILTYLDFVLPENRAKAKPWNFIFKCQDDEGQLEKPLIECKLKLNSVCKVYGSMKVLDEFNLSVFKDSVLAVIGQNGAGKSTLLGIIAGFVEPSSGRVNCARKRFCPQKNVLWDVLTVEEHVEMFSELNGCGQDNILNKIFLQEYHNVQASKLSGGMKRRLSLAISSLGNPDILLLDEPTTGLDPVVRKEIWKFISNISQNKILIFTSHSMEEVQFLSDQVIYLQEGQVKHHCPLAELRLKYCQNYEISIKPTPNSTLPQDLQNTFNNIQINNNTIHISLTKSDNRLTSLTSLLESSSQVEHWTITEDSLANIFYLPSDTLIR